MRHNDEKGMTKPEIVENCGALIIAGSETTATLLSGATFHLLKNPEALRKVTKEVRDTFAAQTDITFTMVAQLPYLNACLKESLRLYPPVPGILPRLTGPEGDIISGQFIPGNVRLDHICCKKQSWKRTNRPPLASTNGAPSLPQRTSKIPRTSSQNAG